MPARYDLLKRYGGESRLKEMAASSAGVREEILAELDHIKERRPDGSGIHPERCVVTQEYRDALRKALG